MWVGYTGGDQISFTPQKQTQPVSSVCCASPESNCCPETNLPAHARWSKPLPRLSFILPLTSFLLLLFLSFSPYKEDSWGVKEGKGVSSSRSYALDQSRLAWQLAENRGRQSWKRVINKHFNGTVERCRQASGHGTTLGLLVPLQVTLHEENAVTQHGALCARTCMCVCTHACVSVCL